MVLILAWLFLKERLRKGQLIGVIIALSGFVAAVSSSSSHLNFGSSIPLTFGGLGGNTVGFDVRRRSNIND